MKLEGTPNEQYIAMMVTLSKLEDNLNFIWGGIEVGYETFLTQAHPIFAFLFKPQIHID